MSTSPDTHTKLDELDVVELVVDSGRWMAGTSGTVVELFPQAALVEIDDDQGHSVDFVSLPFSALRRLDAPVQEHFVV